MQITIAERLRPFCHLPGTSTVLPGSSYQVQIFPCLIRIFDLKQSRPLLLKELTLNLKGPVEQFTLFNDLEKGCITVSGQTKEGWICYHLVSNLRGLRTEPAEAPRSTDSPFLAGIVDQGSAVRLLIEKCPGNSLSIEINGKAHHLRNKEWLDLFEAATPFQPYQVPFCDRLSLGSHKAQDLELMNRRFDLVDILPLLHRLGQMVPSTEISIANEGTLTLLEECRESFISARPDKGEDIWRRFLRGCFHSLFVPQLEDLHYQGLTNFPLVSQEASPLALLSEAAHLIRRLFIQQEKNHLAILPYLLPSFHCGRLLNISLEEGGKLSMEWTKKTIRRLILYAGKDQECSFKFRPDVRSYRLQELDKKEETRKNCKDSLFLKKNCYYLFDNFQ